MKTPKKKSGKKSSLHKNSKPNMKRKRNSGSRSFKPQNSSFKMKKHNSFNNSEIAENKSSKLPLNSNKNVDATKTIFVANITTSTTAKQVKKLFSQYGRIKNVRFRSMPKAYPNMSGKVALAKELFNPKRRTMNCYVVFHDIKSAKNALNANNNVLNGNTLRVTPLEEPQYDNKKAIFIGNIPFDAEEDELRKLFEQCGPIQSVRLIRDGKTQMGKGFGYINFENIDSVELSLQLEDIMLRNRSLRISRCSKTKKLRHRVTAELSPNENFDVDMNRTVVIKKVPANVTEKDIIDALKTNGKVKRSHFITNPSNGDRICLITFKKSHVAQKLHLSSIVDEHDTGLKKLFIELIDQEMLQHVQEIIANKNTDADDKMEINTENVENEIEDDESDTTEDVD